MANLNVKRLNPYEAQRIRASARARGETMRDFVLNSGRLRTDLERAAAALLRDGVPFPRCPVVVASERAAAPPKTDLDHHVRVCPICTGMALQQAGASGDREAGWSGLAGALRVDLATLRARYAALPERDRRVLEAIYGLRADGARRTGADVARELGLSRERIRQLAWRARDELRTGVRTVGKT